APPPARTLGGAHRVSGGARRGPAGAGRTPPPAATAPSTTWGAPPGSCARSPSSPWAAAGCSSATIGSTGGKHPDGILSARPHGSGDPLFASASLALGPRLRGDERWIIHEANARCGSAHR